MSPKLYMVHLSPPVRAVLMVAQDIGLNLELVEMDIAKLNPTHTIPTLVDDDGFVLWESHAILPYLVKKYGKSDSLYPKDLKKKAIIHQKLHFETGVLFARIAKIMREFGRGQKKTIDKGDIDSLNEVYGFVETFLTDSKWIAGDSPTIADYSLIASICTANLLVPVNSEKYPKLMDWWKRCETLDGDEANKKGLDIGKQLINSLFK